MPLSGLEGLPSRLLLFTGVTNLVYGSYSFSLAVRAERLSVQRSTFLRPARLGGDQNDKLPLRKNSLVPFDVGDNKAFYESSNLYSSARDLSRWAPAWGRPN